MIGPAKDTVRKVFARIGVLVQYPRAFPHDEQVSRERAMVVHLTMDCDHPMEDGPAAVTQPYEGSSIQVCYQRVKWAERNMFLGPKLIGYIMVHEITHNLQGIARHSGTGIMKATWTTSDYRDITDLQLRFEETDVFLIDAGWKWRSKRAQVKRVAHTR